MAPSVSNIDATFVALMLHWRYICGLPIKNWCVWACHFGPWPLDWKILPWPWKCCGYCIVQHINATLVSFGLPMRGRCVWACHFGTMTSKIWPWTGKTFRWLEVMGLLMVGTCEGAGGGGLAILWMSGLVNRCIYIDIERSFKFPVKQFPQNEIFLTAIHPFLINRHCPNHTTVGANWEPEI